MALDDLQKGTRILETIENYSRTGKISAESPIDQKMKTRDFFDDEMFWRYVSNEPSHHWGMEVQLYDFTITDWIARVPGLYWSPCSESIRRHRQHEIEFQSEEWTIFQPIGKSRKVLGGLGTLILPPTEDGRVLISASAGCNASTGIPLLLHPDVYEQVTVGDCVLIRGAKWQPMDIHWASNFASTKEIPRGYLVVDSVDKLIIRQRNIPVLYHPFTLMEYEYNNSLLYDFVYVTVDSALKNGEAKTEKFFKDYAKAYGRYGEYLLNPNVVKPIFQSRYQSPIELTKPSEKAKLSILYERIRNSCFSMHSIEELAIKLPQFYQSSKSVLTLTKNVGINVAFLQEESPANMAFQLIDLCLKRGKVEELVDRILLDYPNMFN